MTKLISILLAAAVAGCTAQQLPFPVESFETPTGDQLEITMIHHGSIALSYKDFNIQIDPVMQMGELQVTPIFLPGLAYCSLWSCKDLNMT